MDRCLSPAFSDALNKSPEITACHLRDVYGEGPGQFVQDVDWIRECGRHGWVAITQNPKIGSTPREIDAIVEHGAKVFSLAKADLPPHEQGLIVGRYLLRVARRDRRPGGCFWRIHLERPQQDVA